MPSVDHEAIIDLFRKQPRLVTEVMRASFDLSLPGDSGKPVESTIGEVVPTEYRADLVVAFETVRVIIEVQLRKDDKKRWSWPAYVTSLRARERCDAYLLVVTPSAEVERWARNPIALGNPGSCFVPLVLGPEGCPPIMDGAIALRHPELTILTAILRSGAEPDRKGLLAALKGAVTLDDDRSKLYMDLVLRAAGADAQQVWEAFMATPHDYEYKSEIMRQLVAEGLEKGLEQGLEKGLAAGRIAATAEAVLKVLAARGLPVSDAARQAILSATDLDTLERWHDRSFAVGSVEELLGAPPSTEL